MGSGEGSLCEAPLTRPLVSPSLKGRVLKRRRYEMSEDKWQLLQNFDVSSRAGPAPARWA